MKLDIVIVSSLWISLLPEVLSRVLIPQLGGNFPMLLNVTSPLQLAAQPACGSFDSETFTEINTGISTSDIRTVVAFGDSWTSNGSNGSIPVPPIMWPPFPFAGGLNSSSRATNGFVWVEILANSFNGAKLLNYAWGGAVIDKFAWNTTSPNNATRMERADFVEEMALFFLQGKYFDSLSPSQTLYVVAFGINDQNQWNRAGGDWDIAYNTYVSKLGELQANGAKNILIHGKYQSHEGTDTLQSRVFNYLRESHVANGTHFAFVNLERLFTDISNNPLSYGYTGNTTCLVSVTTTEGGCDDPELSVFWMPGHPTTATHGLISEYTRAVLAQCVV